MRELRNRFEAAFFPLNIKGLFGFAAIWGPLGFSLGLSLLMGPVRWYTDGIRNATWMQQYAESIEKIGIKLIILAFVGTSFFVAVWLYNLCRQTRLRHVRYAIPALCWLAAGGALWLVLNPDQLKDDRGQEIVTNERFTFGPYPDQAKLLSLKEEGYQGVISLLHSAVVPFEPVNLEREREAASKAGIELIEAPMLPWVSSNEASLAKIREIALNQDGRYYVHCYLGKDRVRAVQRMLASLIGEGVQKQTDGARKISDRNHFERGPVYRLKKDSYLTPLLSAEAFTSYVVAGGLEQVISLLDLSLPEEKSWHLKEKELAKIYSVPLISVPLSKKSFQPAQILDAARQVRLLSGSFVVHDFSSNSPHSRAFLTAYEYDLPPINPELFTRKLERGAVISLNANLALGPRPTADEFLMLANQMGIREFLFMGSANDTIAIEDSQRAKTLGIEWHIPFPRFDNIDKIDVRKGGPCYLYSAPDPPFRRILGEKMERGNAVMLAPDVWMTPQPTPSEWAEILDSGYFAHVLNLLHPSHSSEKRWVDADEEILARHGMQHSNNPTEPDHVNPIEILKAAEAALDLPRPLLIHAFRTDSARAKAFQQSFWGKRPAWILSYLKGPLAKKVQLLAPNVLFGPKPSNEEIEFLIEAGARGFVYAGPIRTEEGLAESARFSYLKKNWHSKNPSDQSITEYLVEGGPWYLYGPEMEMPEYGPRIISRLAPPVLNQLMYARESSSRPKAVAQAAAIEPPPAPVVGKISLSGFLQQVRPTPRQVILSAPVFLLWAALVMAFCGKKRKERRWKVGYTRKLFHFCIFTSATLVQGMGGLSATCLLGGIVSLLVVYTTWRGKSLAFFDALARPKDAPREKLFIIVPLITTAVAGLLANFLFGKFALVGYMVGGWGDAVGEPVGTRWGTIRYKVPSIGGVPAQRSLQGSTAVMIASGLAALITLLAMGYDFSFIWTKVATIAVISALVEGLSPHGTDNLTVPLAAAGIAYWGLA